MTSGSTSNSITDISALSGLTHLNSLLLSNNPDLSNIQPLLDNTGLGTPTSFGGRFVDLRFTSVSCTPIVRRWPSSCLGWAYVISPPSLRHPTY